MSLRKISVIVLVVVGGVFIALASRLGYGILGKRQSMEGGSAKATSPQIKPIPLPTRVFDAQGNPIPETELQSTREYKVGRALGDCLTQGCQVFWAVVTEIGEPEKKTQESDEWAVLYRKIALNIDEWLWGDRQHLGSPIEITYASKPQMFKSSPGPWSVWEGVGLKVGEKILVALRDDKASKESRSEEIALVVSDKELASKFLESLKLHEQVSESPSHIERLPALLRAKRNNVLAGCVVSYLTHVGAKSKNDDRVVHTLSSLVSLISLPPIARDDVAKQLTVDFRDLSAETRQVVVESLLATATANDLNQATPALSSLVWLTDTKALDLRPYLRGEQKTKLIANYRALIAENRSDKFHEAFESQLGLKPSL
jgi:hypothetical protein